MNYTRLSQPPDPSYYRDTDSWKQAVYQWMEDAKANIESDSTINVADRITLAPLASPVFTGTPVAPTAAYGDATTQLATDAFVQAAITPLTNDVGRNKLHNPLFNVNQRGGATYTTNGYTVDRWALSFNGGTSTISTGTSDADRTAIGDEQALYLQNVVVGGSSAANYNQIYQRIESVRRLSGLTVTVSFWAKATSGTPKIGVSLDQNFGTGGSPSAVVTGNGTAITLSTTWTRYNATFTLASANGKTLGSNGDDCTQVNFWFSSGANNNTFAGNIGVQSGTFQLYAPQLEIGAHATPVEKLEYQFEVARCQRFYRSFTCYAIGYNAAGGQIFGTYLMSPWMQSAPTVTYSSQAYSNASALATYTVGTQIFVVQATVTATGQASGTGIASMTADL